ncbi:hypothetical protein FACS1894170_07200 [Planctomycetales bacterium]|nr:hypothetical protein FACS1894170_07200 [Planctomycetales bacterium]
MSISKIFGNLDFATIVGNSDWNESMVRTAIIDKLLWQLGYSVSNQNLLTEKIIHFQLGKEKKDKKADYVLKFGNSFVCVIDAKEPQESIIKQENIEQAYSYANAYDIRSKYFALCNGLEFALFKTDVERPCLLHFALSEIDQHWDNLKQKLSPDSFQTGKPIEYEKNDNGNTFDNTTYCRKLLPDSIPIRRQIAQRHFGVHPYFTKQSWDIVQNCIKNYSKPGDIVLDPFGGSGVTVVESLMLGRKGIHIDINPFANFLVDSLVTPVKIQDLEDAFESIEKKFIEKDPKTKKEIKEALKKYPHPKRLPLPKGSDVKTADKLFNEKQTVQLGLLKSLILKVKDKSIRKTLFLMLSGLVHYYNQTSFDGPHGNTGSSAMWVYRYRIAEHPTALDFLSLLKRRFKTIRRAKLEIKSIITESTIGDAQIIKASATDLSFLKDESVDYIYTDPPYGRNIQYLDLSAMWYASYKDLKPYIFYSYGERHRTMPGNFGARASKLYPLLKNGHYDVKLSAEELQKIALWLDCVSPFYGVYEKEGGEAQLRGEVAYPTLE